MAISHRYPPFVIWSPGHRAGNVWISAPENGCSRCLHTRWCPTFGVATPLSIWERITLSMERHAGVTLAELVERPENRRDMEVAAPGP